MKYVYWRYFIRYEDYYESIEEAVRMAAVDFDYGNASYECILNDDGTIAVDSSGLWDLINKQLDEWGAAAKAKNDKPHAH